MDSSTIVTLPVKEAIAIVALLLGAAWWLLRMFANQVAKTLEARLKAIEEQHAEVKSLRGDYAALRQELVQEYVRREDWIRFSNNIDNKLDRLSDRLNELIKHG